MAEMLVHYIGEYKRAKKEAGGISAAVNFHKLIDLEVGENMDSEMGRRVQCKKGCAFCCNIHVDATDDEADLLSAYMKHENIEIDKEKLQRQSNYDRENWHSQPFEDWSCVFVDDNTKSCKVYEHRPASCRKLLVLSAPQLCDTRNPQQRIQWFAQTEAEAIASATMNATNSDTLVKLLFNKLTNKDNKSFINQ
ncbi:MAG: YkgJ family cysteine cluster protein [Opitutaceae bacterium]|nr:YkgJ family cysteine cluster protein [Opitutaceae bacterium]